MTRVHVLGAAGYAAAEAIRLLDRHPFVEPGVLESRSLCGERLGDHFPLLRTTLYRAAAAGSVERAARAGDVAIVAGSEEESQAAVPALLARDLRVIDLSAAYRLSGEAIYGLSEWNREAIAGARLVANPGCYPTASLLALLPLVTLRQAQGDTAQGDAAVRQIVIDAKSGISGAGRTPKTGSLFTEVYGDVRPYGLSGHRHQPEIERYLCEGGLEANVVFTPQVVPLARGMLVCAYALFAAPPDAEGVAAAYRRAYCESAFVRVLEPAQTPSVAAVAGTNDAEVRVDVLGATVRAICTLDNLGKGAAGQAVQNLNLMLGFPESSGLSDRVVVA